MLYLITSPVNRMYDAMWEVEWALGSCKIKKTPFKGVFLVKTENAIEKIKEYNTTAVCRVVPIEKLISTNMGEIENTCIELAVKKISKKNKFAVRCKNRNSNLSSREIERRVGAKVVEMTGAKVDLENPEIILRIEIIGRKTGISLLKPEEILKKEFVE